METSVNEQEEYYLTRQMRKIHQGSYGTNRAGVLTCVLKIYCLLGEGLFLGTSYANIW